MTPNFLDPKRWTRTPGFTQHRACLVAAVACALLCARPGAAQEPVCGDGQTLRECVSTQITQFGQRRGTVRNSLVTGVASALEELAAGPNVGANTAGSAIHDFIPRFSGALVTEDVTGGLPVVDVRFNAPLGSDSASLRFTLQGGATFHQATAFTPLMDSVAEEERGGLGGDLKDGDDASVFVAGNLESRSWGRSLAPHRGMIRQLAAELVTSAAMLDTTALHRRFSEIGAALTPASLDASRRFLPECAGQFTGFDSRTLPMVCLNQDARRTIESALSQALPAKTSIQEKAENEAFGILARLINNQPQFNADVEYRTREDVVGPTEWTGRARLEFGFTNVNSLRASCPGGDTITVRCLQDYTDRRGVRRALARNLRMWVAGEAIRRSEYGIALPGTTRRLEMEPAMYYSVLAGAGGYLGEITRSVDRLDVQARYAFPHDDPFRQSRAIVSAFYTLKLGGETGGVVGVTWTSRPEFRGHDERRVHVDLGLTYKVNPHEEQDEE